MSQAAKKRLSRADLDALVDRAIEENGTVIVRRPGRSDFVIISADKLRDLDTTEYLLASPKNRRRLLSALRDARAGKGRTMTVAQLRRQVGMET
jgi:antitoxin YefM